MPLGSICNRVKVFSSFHKPRSEGEKGEKGEESQGLEGEGHVPDAFRVRPGTLNMYIYVHVLIVRHRG